jgi:uncharacterized coiled-coil DUF342 family protein
MGHYREPIKYTCPDIDKLIQGLDEINKLIRGYDKLDEVDDLKDLIGDIENILWDYDSKLEELRKSNDELRSWGISEAKEVDRLEFEIFNLTENK